MARTSSSSVQGVLGGHYDTTNAPSLTPFIDTATAMVDEVVTCAASRSVTLSSTILELIERWLAAHFYAQSDQLYQSKNTGGAGASFQGQTAMGLSNTSYGQQAKMLDISGCLAAFDKGTQARMYWLGKPPSSQTPYSQRD